MIELVDTVVDAGPKRVPHIRQQRHPVGTATTAQTGPHITTEPRY
jgi:hypothetical protein